MRLAIVVVRCRVGRGVWEWEGVLRGSEGVRLAIVVVRCHVGVRYAIVGGGG